MRSRWPLLVLLASALALLVSLYLPWTEFHSPRPGLFGSDGLGGWGLLFGQAAGLLALALVGAAAACLLRPRLETRLPLPSGGLAMLDLTLLNAAQLHGTAVFQGAFAHTRVHLGVGAYVGVASSAAAFLAAVAARRDALSRRPSVMGVAAYALTLGLLAAFIIPWLHLHVPHVGPRATTGYELSNRGSDVVVFVAALACFGLPLWTRRTSSTLRLAAALGIAVLTAGGLSILGTHVHWPYEAWLQLGCSLGLLLLALVTVRGVRTDLPLPVDAAAVFAASLLVASLFLPWETFCGGRVCTSLSGWAEPFGGTAGGLAVSLVVLLLGFHCLFVELAVGIAVYVMSGGSGITQFARLGYGAPLGFAGAALLLLVSTRQLPTVRADPKRFLARVVPMGACLCFLAIPIAALTNRLPLQLELDSPWRVHWLEVASILVALRLLGRWLGGSRADVELLLLPLGLLAVTALELIVAGREVGLSWEGWASLGLCLFLAAFGWIERTSGLEKFRLPEEIWRIDRLPGKD